MTRSVPEWVGKTDDTKIPPRVRLRVFEAHKGVCHLTGQKINPGDLWDCDHVLALVNGGENRESNLAPALRKAHRIKTAQDVAKKATERRKRQKHLGIHKTSNPLPGGRKSKFKKKICGQVVRRDEDDDILGDWF